MSSDAGKTKFAVNLMYSYLVTANLLISSAFLECYNNESWLNCMYFVGFYHVLNSLLLAKYFRSILFQLHCCTLLEVFNPAVHTSPLQWDFIGFQLRAFWMENSVVPSHEYPSSAINDLLLKQPTSSTTSRSDSEVKDHSLMQK